MMATNQLIACDRALDCVSSDAIQIVGRRTCDASGGWFFVVESVCAGGTHYLVTTFESRLACTCPAGPYGWLSYHRAVALAELVVRQWLVEVMQATAILAEQVQQMADLTSRVSAHLDAAADRMACERETALHERRAANRPFSIWKA